MRDVGILDVCLVCRIVEDDGIVLQRVVNPFLQLFFRQHRSRRVVRIAEINHIHAVVRYGGAEVVLCRGGHIGYVAPDAVFACARPAYHGVGVDIDGIDGVGDAYGVVPSHDVADIARIALRAVVDEYLRHVEVYAARQEVVLQYRLAQEVVAALRAVASERSFRRHLVNSLVHRLDDGGCEGLGDVSDAEAYHALVGMRDFVCVDFLCDVCKQVTVREFQKVFVY